MKALSGSGKDQPRHRRKSCFDSTGEKMRLVHKKIAIVGGGVSVLPGDGLAQSSRPAFHLLTFAERVHIVYDTN